MTGIKSIENTNDVLNLMIENLKLLSIKDEGNQNIVLADNQKKKLTCR